MALAENDLRTLEQVAEIAVDVLGQVGDASSPTGGWSSYQTLDRLRPQTILVRRCSPRPAAARRGQGTVRARRQFTDRLGATRSGSSIELFRALVASEARRRIAERRGRDVVTRQAVAPTRDRVDFLTCQQAAARRAAGARSSRWRASWPPDSPPAAAGPPRHASTSGGRCARSMSTGGVPMQPVLRQAAPGPARTRAAVRRVGLGVGLLGLHDAAGAGAARPVQQGAGVRLRQRGWTR